MGFASRYAVAVSHCIVTANNPSFYAACLRSLGNSCSLPLVYAAVYPQLCEANQCTYPPQKALDLRTPPPSYAGRCGRRLAEQRDHTRWFFLIGHSNELPYECLPATDRWRIHRPIIIPPFTPLLI